MMKAARLHGPGRLVLEEHPVPTAGDGEILVRVSGALTCGTDVKMWERGHPYAEFPLTLGHEFVGVIEEVGGDLEGFEVGDRVVAANSAPCGECEACRRGKENLCGRLDEAIIGFTSPGVYAEYGVIPARIVRRNTYEVPEGVGEVEAAFLEPLACVVHGLDLVGESVEGTVLVLGGGPIGLLLMQVAKLRGADEVVLSDPHDWKLEKARELGADQVVKAREPDTADRLRRELGGGADLAIEAVGTPETWELAFDLTRPGGTTLMFGGCKTGETVTLDAYRLHYHEHTVLGTFHHEPGSVKEALDLIAGRRLDLPTLVTDSLSLDEIETALDLVSKGEALKVSIVP